MIFGIGLGRTGTTSLAEALSFMGIWTVHGGNLSEHILDQWYESDLILPDHVEAMVETCFCRWYRTADKMYPGSRFILTIRDKDSWLTSLNRWMAQPKPEPETIWFKRRLSSTGRITFHKEVFSNLYDEHHESIHRYFHGRDDLLEISITETPDAELWQSIAEFVDRPIPNLPFPHLNRSTVRRDPTDFN